MEEGERASGDLEWDGWDSVSSKSFVLFWWGRDRGMRSSG